MIRTTHVQSNFRFSTQDPSNSVSAYKSRHAPPLNRFLETTSLFLNGMASHSNNTNKEMGLLGHLPREIRDQIYLCVLDAELEPLFPLTMSNGDRMDIGVETVSSGGSGPRALNYLMRRQIRYTAENDCDGEWPDRPLDQEVYVKTNIFDFRSYTSREPNASKSFLRIREVSTQLCDEMDHIFFSKCDFWFYYSRQWITFFNNIPLERRRWLRRITFTRFALKWTPSGRPNEQPRFWKALKELPNYLKDLEFIDFQFRFNWFTEVLKETKDVIRGLDDQGSTAVTHLECLEFCFYGNVNAMLKLTLEAPEHGTVLDVSGFRRTASLIDGSICIKLIAGAREEATPTVWTAEHQRLHTQRVL